MGEAAQTGGRDDGDVGGPAGAPDIGVGECRSHEVPEVDVRDNATDLW